MKTLKDFYVGQGKLVLPELEYKLSKPKNRNPLGRKEQETLNMYIRQVYNPHIKKLKEAEYFREEWMEPASHAKI